MCPEYAFRSNYVKLDGCNIHYIDEGTGEPVLLLHGSATWSFLYRNLIRTLGPNKRVIAPDMLGFGLSEKNGEVPSGFEKNIELLSEFILQLNLEGITLVMHGWGAAIGLGIMVKHPTLIKKVILLNGISFRIPVSIPLLLVAAIPFVGIHVLRKTNLVMRSFFSQNRGYATKENKLYYMSPYAHYIDRKGIYQFFGDIPISRHGGSNSLLREIQRKIKDSSSIPWHAIFCSNKSSSIKLLLDKWGKYAPWAKVKIFHDQNHFMLEDKESDVIKYIVNILDNEEKENKGNN